MPMPTLQQIIGTITGKVAFERTQANFTTIKDAHNGLETNVGPLASLTTTIKTSIVNAINSLKGEVDAHKAESATQLGRTVFNVTPEPGITIVKSNCYVINKIAYVYLTFKKTDDTAFAAIRTDLALVPHGLLPDFTSLMGYAIDAGGNPQIVQNPVLPLWNKKLAVSFTSATAKTVYISGNYLIP